MNTNIIHYIYICMYLCMYVCMHVCMYVCMYAYMYVSNTATSNMKMCDATYNILCSDYFGICCKYMRVDHSSIECLA